MRHSRLVFVVLTGALLSACGAPAVRTSNVASDSQQAASLQVKMGQEYMSKGELETAQDKLRRAIELDPKSVDAHLLLGLLNERIRRPELAERFYRKAVDLKPDDGAVNNNFGTFLCGVGRYDEAERHFLVALDDPFYKTPAVAFGNAGVCARQAGDTDKAEAYFRRALEIDANSLTALYELASLVHKRGEPLRARAFIQRFEARGQADAALLLLALEVETELGDSKAADAYRQRLKEQYPDLQIPPELATPQS